MAQAIEFLCDTSVLIDYLRGDEKVREILKVDRFGRMSMSSVTLMELVVGAFNKQEVRKIRNAFNEIRIVHVYEAISSKAVELIVSYSKSHNLLIPDGPVGPHLTESDFLHRYHTAKTSRQRRIQMQRPLILG